MADESVTWTKEEILEEAKRFRDQARRVFLEDGYHIPITFLFTTKNPKTGAAEKTTAMVPVLGKFEEQDKEAYSRLVRSMAQEFQAVGIIFISEMWMLSYSKEGMTKEEVKAQQKKWTGHIHAHPERIEGLMLTCEHSRFGSVMWVAEVHRPNGPDGQRDPDGKPELGPWKGDDRFPEGNGLRSREGRFVDMLPQVD